VKFYDKGSSFKKKLLTMKKGDTIVASGLAGDFVLPKNKKKKLVFIAGGIGITPFRSMIQYLVDTKEARDVVLLYSNKRIQDIAYEDVFDKAEETLGIRSLYAITDPGSDIPALPNVIRTIDARTISQNIPDYKERIFYLSGPHGMVNAFQELLQSMGVKENHIKTDFFPGFA
jgi:ferredoxin-NADP reductase